MRLVESPADPVLDYFQTALSPYSSSSFAAKEAAETVRETLSLCGAEQGWTDEMEVFMLGRMVYLFGANPALNSFLETQTLNQSSLSFLQRLIMSKIPATDCFRLIESGVLVFSSSFMGQSAGLWTLHVDRAIYEAASVFELGYLQVLKRIFGAVAVLSAADPGRDTLQLKGIERLSPDVAAMVKKEVPLLMEECFERINAPRIALIWAI